MLKELEHGRGTATRCPVVGADCGVKLIGLRLEVGYHAPKCQHYRGIRDLRATDEMGSVRAQHLRIKNLGKGFGEAYVVALAREAHYRGIELWTGASRRVVDAGKTE